MIEQAIRARVPELLQSGDLDKLTDRSVIRTLKAELGASVDDYKALVIELINQFLDSKAADDEEAEDDGFEPSGSKRKSGPPTMTQPSKTKKMKAAGNDEFVVELDHSKRACVKLFNGKVRVDLREYYEDKSSRKMKPGPKGISLEYKQWMVLTAQLPGLTDAANSGKETMTEPVLLSSNRHAYVQKFQSKYLVHVREMYEKEGKMMPGKKGVALDTEAVTELSYQADDITAAALQLGATAEAEVPPRPVSAPAVEPGKKAMQENIHPGMPDAGSDAFVDLGAEKRAMVKEFKGKTYVDLREYYAAEDGQKLPGKKGIMLNPETFRKIAQHAAAISEASASNATDFELDLGNMLKVTTSAFKGKTYVGIREFYEDKADGSLKPGKKGLSMSSEQWNKLVAGLPHIAASLGMPLS